MEKEEEIEGYEEQNFFEEEHVHSADDHAVSVNIGNEDQDVYTQQGREALEESDEIAPWEESFAEGASGKGKLGSCAHCENVLSDNESEVERKYKGRVYRFCSEKCAESGPQ